jgi:hypothetical protein
MAPVMAVRLFSNGVESEVGPFVAKFTENVCRAAAASLRAPAPARSLEFVLEGKAVRFEVDGLEVSFAAGGFAATIVHDTLSGMVRHLKGIDPAGVLRILVEIDPSAACNPPTGTS